MKLTYILGCLRRVAFLFLALTIAGAASADMKTWTGSGDGQRWDNADNWSPAGVPTSSDAVEIAGSATVYAPYTATCHSLRIGPSATFYLGGTGSTLLTPTLFDATDLTDRTFTTVGDLVVEGKALFGARNTDVETRVTIGGDMVVSNTASAVYAFAGKIELDLAQQTWQQYKRGGASFDIGGNLKFLDSAKVYVVCHNYSGMPVVWNVAGDVTVGVNAVIYGSNYVSDKNVTGFGWKAGTGNGQPTYNGKKYVKGCAYQKGGAYGGTSDSNSGTYGYANAPFYPGAGGYYWDTARGDGGGAVRIATKGIFSLDGKIYVTGGHATGNNQGAGSGGSVWLTCRDFEVGENALIHARGGSSSANTDAQYFRPGGGGRVAIIKGDPTDAQLEQLYATGSCADLAVIASDMSDSERSPYPTLVNVTGGTNPSYSSKNGRAGTAVFLEVENGEPDPGAATKTWVGMGDAERWDVAENWYPAGVPTIEDVIDLADALTVYAPFTASVGSLRIGPSATLYLGGTGTVSEPGLYDSSDLTDRALNVASNLVVEGTVVFGAKNTDVATRVSVGCDMVVSNTASVYAFAGKIESDVSLQTWRQYKQGGASFAIGRDLEITDSAKIRVVCHSESGMPVVWNVASNVTIGVNAIIYGSEYVASNNVAGFGWRAGRNTATGNYAPWGMGYKEKCGGAYGGASAYQHSQAQWRNENTYGFAYAPFYPGAGGYYWDTVRGLGGGAVRIAAGGAIVLDGKIYVTGGSGGSRDQGGGSGGSVWLTAATFAAGENALIDARGGTALAGEENTYFRAGGGGRVAIMTGGPSDAQLESLYERGTCHGIAVLAADMGVSPWPTLVDVSGGVNTVLSTNSGSAGTAVYLSIVNRPRGLCIIAY